MYGLNFIHAGFLAAGFAIALPIVIHLLFRQKTRKVSIGSVRFLHQVVKEHRRRRLLRQWILLAMRMLVILLLALLFARPYFDGSHARGLEQEVVVLIDRSASMQAKGSQQRTVFEQARVAAREEISRLDENVVVHVATFDMTGIHEIPIDELSGVAPTEAGTDFGLPLAWAKDILNASNRRVRQIVLISDMQRTGLPPSSLDQLPEGIDLRIRDVSEPLPRNFAIESADAIRTEIRPDSKVTVRVLLRNYGALPGRKLATRCELTNQAGASFYLDQDTDIAGNGFAILDFPFSITADGLYKGQVTIEVDDALALDNRRLIAFEARHPDRILLVDGHEGRSVFSNETYFLETALSLQTEEANGQIRSFEVDRIVWEAGEGFPRLDGYRAIVLANLRRLSATDAKRLDAFIRGGGKLLIFAGEQVQSDSLAALQERGLLPGKLADAPVEGRLRIDRWDARHPALACFADPQQGDLRRVEFQKLLPLVSLDPASHGLLFVGELAVAVEREVDMGRCLYFASTADRDWTELPRTPMYVPLMRQLMAYLTDQLAERSLVKTQLVRKPGDTVAITNDPVEEGRWIVTNLDPRESALDRITETELLQRVGRESPAGPDGNDARLNLTIPGNSLRQDEIWTTLVWCLFSLLAAETLLAGRVHA